MDNIEQLQKWFGGLGRSEQVKILQFLYGNDGRGTTMLLQEGVYCGPRPEFVKKGLFVGPAPQAQTRTCGQCGRPL